MSKRGKVLGALIAFVLLASLVVGCEWVTPRAVELIEIRSKSGGTAVEIWSGGDIIAYSGEGTGQTFKMAGSTGDTDVAGAVGIAGAVSLSNNVAIAVPTAVATATPAVLVDSLAVGALLEVRKAATPMFQIAGNGNTYIAGALDIRGAISDGAGDLELNDNVAVSGTLGVTGASTLTGVLTVNNNAVVTGTSDLQGHIANSTGNLSLNDAVDVAGALGVTGASTLTGVLTVNNNVVVTGTSDLQGAVANSTGTLTLNDDVSITGALTLPLQTAHLGAMSVATQVITWTGAAGGNSVLLTIPDGQMYLIYSVFIRTTTDWVTDAADDEFLHIGDAADVDGFMAAGHAQLLAAFTEATGYAAGFYGIEAGSEGAYTLLSGGPFVYVPSGADAEITAEWGSAANNLTAGESTVYIVYMRIL